jgi:hypothetical protein
MALRDVRSDCVSVATGAYLDIQPTDTEEWALHNIYHDGAVELYFYDGTNNCKFDSDATFGWYPCHDMHCTNTNRVRVKNLEATSQLIGYDGVLTHT